jgi:hypothetical protein
MSFQVLPAPRMTIAPIRNKTISFGSGHGPRFASAAMAADHQQGRSNNHQPIGRSIRASRK